MSQIYWLSYFSGLSFLGFGFSCFFSNKMVLEFERYQLARFRTTTGFFQIVGAIGLLCASQSGLIWSISSLGIKRFNASRLYRSFKNKRQLDSIVSFSFLYGFKRLYFLADYFIFLSCLFAIIVLYL